MVRYEILNGSPFQTSIDMHTCHRQVSQEQPQNQGGEGEATGG